MLLRQDWRDEEIKESQVHSSTASYVQYELEKSLPFFLRLILLISKMGFIVPDSLVRCREIIKYACIEAPVLVGTYQAFSNFCRKNKISKVQQGSSLSGCAGARHGATKLLWTPTYAQSFWLNVFYLF